MYFEMNLQNLASQYVSFYIRWLQSNGINLIAEECYYLLDYSISMIYDVPCSWYTESIVLFGNNCINFLVNNIATVHALNYEARVSLVSLCHSYLIAYYN